MQSVTIRDPVEYIDNNGDKKTKYVINANETMIARSKQQQIKETFASWLFADKDRAEILLNYYNERFNRIKPREYDGSHLHFKGMSEERELRQHQKNVAARIVYHGTCLMAHEVGAGKTAAMIAAGMYMKNMGVIKKPIYVVPNHLTEQWANEFMRFFPSANILVTTKEDFKKNNRKKFISKIATGEYDAIIVGHSQFEKIPISQERQEQLLNEEISTLTYIIEQMKEENGENWAIKQMVIFQNNLKERLNRLVKEERKDDLLNFEQLGVDYMFVDEAHAYKNCYTYTKMRNVAGIGQSKSQRASDMLMKCQYLQEINKGRGVTFATGTPISNSMSEMFVMQRFLQPDILKKTGVHFFDKWAATFGDTISSLEINPEGSGYRIKNRFSRFHNIPELMKMFRIVADIQTRDMLNLPVPEIDGGKAKVIVTERSDFQTQIMESFVQRADDIRNRRVDPETDNMLKLTNEARLMAIDPRLVYPDAPNDPDSKLNTCIRSVYDIWNDTADERLTQVIFCDSGTPKPEKFNVYDETKEQLIKMGVPADEIAFVHDAKTDAQREAMFEKTRKGEIRVLLGSTGKLGTGTNIQSKLYALHHLDVPWRPSDIIQRDGRGLRFGNENGIIKIFRYVTKNTFDAYLWQLQEQKLRYTTQIMTNKSVSRSAEDIDETVLTAAEIKAIATSNPLLAEKMEVDNEVTRLKLLKGNWTNERFMLERSIEKRYPDTIFRTEEQIKGYKLDIAVLDKHKGGDFIITIDGKVYNERVVAGEALLTVARAKREAGIGQHPIGSYRGLDLCVERNNMLETKLKLVGRMGYTTPIGDSAIGCITRIENLAERLPGLLSEAETKLVETKHQLDNAMQAVTKPFEYEEKLAAQLTRQSEINTALEFKELSKQQGEFLSDPGAGESAENEMKTEEEYEDEIEAA
jgi:SNF2 family DNA or RNA helicase